MTKHWNFTLFVARKLKSEAFEGKKVARPITRIATFSIVLAMIVNIVTIAVVNGFQKEVSHKVIGFGSHITIQQQNVGQIQESQAIERNLDLEASLQGINGVTGVFPCVYKPALLQSRQQGEQKEILGVMLKGVDRNYDWHFFENYLIEGKLPDFKKDDSKEILISNRIAKDLHYKLGDTLNAYFVKKRPIMRQFQICGIYETGLEDFDKRFAYVFIRQTQQLNDFGIQATLTLEDSLFEGALVLNCEVNGGNGKYRYDWGKGWKDYGRITFYPEKDTTIRVIATDYITRIDESPGLAKGIYQSMIPDTSYLDIKTSGIGTGNYKTNNDGLLQKEYLDNDGYHYRLFSEDKSIEVETFPGLGSLSKYIQVYELGVNNFEDLEEVQKKTNRKIRFNANLPQQLEAINIREQESELFSWLDFLDYNMVIVLVLMLIIGIVNMGSALLVMILMRTQFIGVFKAMGASNWQLRKMFVAYIGTLILKGMFWGNLLGFGLCLAQKYFHVIPLDPKVYYLNAVPIDLNWGMFIALNLITLLISMLALILPTFLIAQISPSKTIKFR